MMPFVMRRNGYYTTVFHLSEWTRPDKQAGYTNLQKICEKYHDSIENFRTSSSVTISTTAGTYDRSYA